MPFERIGNAVVLSAGTAGDQFMSDATQLANGDIIAVWCDGDLSALDPSFAVKGQRFAADGSKIGVEFTVMTGSGTFTDPDVAALPDGGFAVSYTDAGRAASSRYDAAGVFQGEQAHLAGDHNSDPVPADPGFSLGEYRDRYAEYSDDNTVILTGPGISGQYLVLAQQHHYVEGGTNPWGYMKWEENNGIFIDDAIDGTTEGVFAAHDRDLDEAWGVYSPGQNRVDATDFRNVDAANLGDGTFAVVFESPLGNGQTETFIQHWTVNSPTSLPSLIDETSDISNGSVETAVAAFTGGGYAVASARDDTADQSVRVKFYDNDGTPRNGGAAITISTGGTKTQPQMVGLADGRFMVTWTDGSSGTSADVRSQIIDPTVFTGSAGGDTVIGGTMEDTFSGGNGADTLDGRRGNDTLQGETGADILNGGDGNDVLDGGTEGDTMTGGRGDDTYFVDIAIFDDVVEATNEGIDTVWSTVNYTLGTGEEILRSMLGGSATHLGGNALANSIYGNILAATAETIEGGRGADSLYGFGGNDTLRGQAGRDVLDGGSGDDTMEGGRENDTYIVDSAGDIVTELLGDGDYDKVVSSISYTLKANVEALELAPGAAIDGTGNGLGSAIFGNNSANLLKGLGGIDGLYGYGGADTLQGGKGCDFLNGGLGADALDGGDGIDAADYSTSAEGVSANIGLGTGTGGEADGDTLVNIENLIGSALGDDLKGGTGDNELYGNAGGDSLYGMGGADTITAGSGLDLIVYRSTSHSLVTASDTITDFSQDIVSRDLIDVSAIDAQDVGSAAGDQAFAWAGPGGFTDVGQIYAFQSGVNTVIQFNTKGSTAPEMQIILANFDAANLSISDFIV